MPFVSRQQARWAHATDQPFARRWDKETDFAKLPKRVKRIRSRMGLKGCTCKALATETPSAARTIAPTAAAPAAKPAGGSLGPGITRIRGNLCNVHGKYGPCDAALSKKKPKGGKGRAAAKPKKPKLTGQERQSARDDKKRTNAADVAKRMSDADTGLSSTGSAALLAMRTGTQPDATQGPGLVTMGLAEQASDGSYRMTPTGRAVVGAMESGDYQRAIDTISRGTDTATARTGRQTAAAQRRQDTAGKRAAAQIGRDLAKNERAARLAQRQAAAAAKKKPSAGAKKPTAQAAPSKRAARLSKRGGGGSSASGGGSSAAPKKPVAPKPEKPSKEQQQSDNRASVRDAMAQADQGLAPGGFDNLIALGGGKEPDDIGAQGLISMGMAEMGTDGTLRLTTAGRQAIAAANRGDAKAAIDVISRASEPPTKKEMRRAQRIHAMQTYKAGSPGDYLVVEDPAKPTTWHLQVRRNGKPDHGLMGGAWAALHGGYRGNTYAGPNKAQALTKLRALYASEKMPLPSEKDFTEKAQTAEDRAMFAKMGGGGSGGGGGGSGGGGSKLWSKDPKTGKRKPTDSEIKSRVSDLEKQRRGYETLAEVSRYGMSPSKGYESERHAHAKIREIDREIARLKKQKPSTDKEYTTGKESTFTVYKDATGADRWVSVSSTAYRDRDKEIVSTKALTGAVALADASGARGPLRFWHVPGVELGDCDYQATAQDGRFLIESGTFRSPALAAAVKSHADDYQLSIGFTHPPNEPDSHGVFSHIAIFERSLVPRGRASNPLTQLTLVTKEIRMLTEEKQAELTRLLDGNGELLAGLLGKIASTDKAAQDGGIAYKDAPDIRAIIREELASLLSETTEKAAPPPMMAEGTPEEEAAESPEEEQTEMDAGEGDAGDYMDAEELASLVAQKLLDALMPHLGIGQKMDEVKSMLGGMAGGYAKKDAELAEVKETLATVQAQVADLSGGQPRIMAGGYRASQSSATVTTDDRLKEAQPSADPRMAAFSDFLGELGLNQPAQPGV